MPAIHRAITAGKGTDRFFGRPITSFKAWHLLILKTDVPPSECALSYCDFLPLVKSGTAAVAGDVA